MEIFLEKLNKVKEVVKLPEEVRSSMRLELLQVMKDTPAILAIPESIPSPWVFFTHKHLQSSFVLATLVLVGVSSSFAAERSLPGDFLYPIKVNFNEKIVAKLQITPLAQANYATVLANKRIGEAKKLKEKDNLTDEKKTYLDSQFEVQTNIATKNIQIVETAGDVDEAVKLSKNLKKSVRSHDEFFSSEKKGRVDASIDINMNSDSETKNDSDVFNNKSVKENKIVLPIKKDTDFNVRPEIKESDEESKDLLKHKLGL